MKKLTEDEENAYECMLVGTGLDTVPLQARRRVLKVAEMKYSWTEAHWPSQKNCTRLVRAMRAVRDLYLIEGAERGVNELDGAMHRLCSAAGAKLGSLKA